MTGAWLRLELRRRWRTLLVLALLIGFAAATVLTAVAGARRGESSLQRLADATLPATVQVVPNEPGFDWDAVRDLPGVAAVGEMVFAAYELDGEPVDGPVPADGTILSTVERPVVLEGRRASPQRPDEAVVTPGFVASYGRGVGDTVTLRLYRPETLRAGLMDFRGPASAGRPTPADGPAVPVRIVGVVRSALISDVAGDPGWVIPTGAFYAAYTEHLVGSDQPTSAVVRLSAGGSGVADFKAALAQATGRTDVSIWNLAATTDFDQGIVDIETTALLVFATAAGVAAMFLVGQAIARYAAAAVAELRVLRALGLSPRQVVVAATTGPVLAAVLGATAGAVVSVLASAWFPVGTAARREPAPGIDVDWAVVATGWGGIVLATGAGAALTAGLALRATRAPTSSRRSTVAAAAARAGLPLPVVLGAGLALETGRGERAVPVRPALVGAVVGVVGTVAALTVAAGVDDARTNPVRYGQVHDLDAALDVDAATAADALAVLAADAEVAAVNDSRSAVADAGSMTPMVYSFQPVAEPLPVVLTAGRMPARADELALAPYTASTLGAGIGDTVDLTGTRSTSRLTVTGLAFVPEGPENYNIDGAWVSAAGFDQLFDGAAYHVAHIALRDGADPAGAAQRLGAAVSDGVAVTPTLQRDHSVELQVIRAFPLYLAVFLTVLAVGAVGHALAAAVRRRRRDLAVLRALGLTGGQSRGVVVTQAVTIVLAGLVLGAPLGVAVGRSVWRYVTDATVTQYVPPPALAALFTVVPLALVAAVLLAVVPARRAGSFPVWRALRAE
ncbi:FtsX-like permease family protein [Jiangella anatolica]|uniref:ABC3 transporter permease C-terminal domain-containing protein n=1 Tax=Jiangella anatolica TaxID=2670374 RepID=A0A2W2C9M9_9ACTN|nr:FtsX-like permease family protein [Jiangella anatolica]PZF84927.1 hypothetical protein C1I92_06385 [Jiangella anatolica]